jgi:hypothetical protein
LANSYLGPEFQSSRELDLKQHEYWRLSAATCFAPDTDPHPRPLENTLNETKEVITATYDCPVLVSLDLPKHYVYGGSVDVNRNPSAEDEIRPIGSATQQLDEILLDSMPEQRTGKVPKSWPVVSNGTKTKVDTEALVQNTYNTNLIFRLGEIGMSFGEDVHVVDDSGKGDQISRSKSGYRYNYELVIECG